MYNAAPRGGAARTLPGGCLWVARTPAQIPLCPLWGGMLCGRSTPLRLICFTICLNKITPPPGLGPFCPCEPVRVKCNHPCVGGETAWRGFSPSTENNHATPATAIAGPALQPRARSLGLGGLFCVVGRPTHLVGAKPARFHAHAPRRVVLELRPPPFLVMHACCHNCPPQTYDHTLRQPHRVSRFVY